MFKELITRLYDYSVEHDLYFEFVATRDECSFTIQDRERTWGYHREVLRSDLELCNTKPEEFAECTLALVKMKTRRMLRRKEKENDDH